MSSKCNYITTMNARYFLVKPKNIEEDSHLLKCNSGGLEVVSGSGSLRAVGVIRGETRYEMQLNGNPREFVGFVADERKVFLCTYPLRRVFFMYEVDEKEARKLMKKNSNKE